MNAKVGDRVNFKEDIEGHGVVVKVESRYSRWLCETVEEYWIASPSEPNGYPFHPAAYFDYELNRMVVRTDRIF